MQLEIEWLKRELRHAKRKRISSYSDEDSDDEQDITYKQRSRTPVSESFSYEKEHHRKKIEEARLPLHFNQPMFTIYNGRTDPVEHVSHFNQRMAIYSKNEALMCKVFPSSLGPVAMRWFDSLEADSINSFKERTQAFGSRFVTCRRVARPLSSLLSLSMQEDETLKMYSDRYWEMFNDMEGNFDGMALSTFKLGLPTDHGLRKSLTGKPVTNMRRLIDRIKKYKRVEEDQQQSKGKDKVIPQERRDFKSDRYNNNKSRRDFAGQSGSTNLQAVNTIFKEPVHQVLERIKNEPFFKWPNKIVGNSERCNHNFYCQYHQDYRHTTENCRSLWDHLDQLVREGKLRHLLHHSSGRGGQMSSEPRRDDPSKPPLGTINVIFATPGRTGSWPSKVMSVTQLPAGDFGQGLKRAKLDTQPVLEFSDEDKIGTIQPHDDALVITLRIGGYDVKRVMVDQGSAVEIMYPNLYKGLNLKPQDLTPYNSPLISFEGRVVTPKGQIQLPVQTGSEVVDVDFIVVDVYSPYTAIVARPWLHALGAVSSILHQKIKYPSERQVCKIRGDQFVARQCLVAAIQHEPKIEASAQDKNGSTYQRMMTRMFESQLGKSIKVYIDDMMVKSKVVSEHVNVLGNIFEVLRKHKLRLNASKCSFGVGSCKFLGYMVTHRGIEVNPDQIKAIHNLQARRNPKEV
ncbi:uncharacterized protein LOC136067263 [Quercus suber]|uniref:uncharacterized protein LOC136067263 n=1 Tax=Quercus suber TaxID=58331 RepID=UPI0032DED085